ncbi:anthocyanidin 3-O-glucosyltransferase 2-like [Oryza brachyantha]|uniref:Malvidin galactosylase UGT88C3 n=1 Tax=Oryza brachyantha TaxID=4533 RepID=J3ML88_ORYBR|nr:anthocyanidin 3-O-glucosyltransferase 2-like [Oryza brachyantha]
MAKPTVVLLPVWGDGHFMPMIEFGKRLVRASGGAMSVTVLLMPAPTPQAGSDIADHVRREEAEAAAAADGGGGISFKRLPAVEIPTDHTGIDEFISRVVRSHVPHVKAAIEGLACPAKALVFDIFCTPALDASRDLAVPAYVYFASAGATLALFLRSPAIDEEVAGEFEEMDGMLDVPGLLPLPATSLPDTLLDRKMSTYEWFVYTGRRYMDATGFIVNTAADLEPSVLAAIADGRCTGGIPAPTVYPIGPVLALPSPPEQPHECVRWLDSHPRASVLLLCFGSKGVLTPTMVTAIADGLERSGHRFLWVLRGPPVDNRDGARHPTDAALDEMLPEGFLERTKGRGLVWPTRAPQKEILAHAATGGFVTHCGWNSILESLWFGVPMLPWPLAAEQHLNAFALVAGMGVAVPLKVHRKRGNFVEAADLEQAVRALMGGGEEGRKAREKTLELKAVCRKAVEEGGSSRSAFQRLYEEIHGGGAELSSKNESVKADKAEGHVKRATYAH